MADKKISQLEEKTILEANDEFPFVREENGTYINYKVKRSNITTTVPNATSSVLGSIRLTGDLGGTALNPTVPGLISKANLTSPTFTGTPTAPTPANGDNTTKLATTAFVNTAINNATNIIIPDATSLLKGIIQLAGDLAGTADNPTVPGLLDKVDSADLATVATSGDYNDLINIPTFAGVAVSGDYNDLLNIPAPVTQAVSSVSGKVGAVTLDKADVNLNNVDNTSDLDKPISTATQTALDSKQNTLAFTPENVSNKSTLVSLGTSDTLYPTQNAVKSYVDTIFLNSAKTNVSQQYTGFQGNVRVNQNISGAVTIDASLANIYDLTLIGDVTSFTLTNLQSGYYTFNFIQGTTPYTFVWDTNIFKAKDVETITITNTANKKFKVIGDSNGTVIEYEIGVYSI